MERSIEISVLTCQDCGTRKSRRRRREHRGSDGREELDPELGEPVHLVLVELAEEVMPDAGEVRVARGVELAPTGVGEHRVRPARVGVARLAGDQTLTLEA